MVDHLSTEVADSLYPVYAVHECTFTILPVARYPERTQVCTCQNKLLTMQTDRTVLNVP